RSITNNSQALPHVLASYPLAEIIFSSHQRSSYIVLSAFVGRRVLMIRILLARSAYDTTSNLWSEDWPMEINHIQKKNDPALELSLQADLEIPSRLRGMRRDVSFGLGHSFFRPIQY
ncbi:MAG TPA: hypothetical protein VJV03_15315, partial [Pyrinomonadaceae bacterium]|nr:hypothetical protein [Pyrinomonadaceae bacterium]